MMNDEMSIRQSQFVNLLILVIMEK